MQQGTDSAAGGAGARRRILITAGPTHEPIDAVRYIGNRSSGRLGVALADRAARRGWDVRLLLGPSALRPGEAAITVRGFITTAELRGLLSEEAPRADVIVMAAAVADFRPAAAAIGKIRRGGGGEGLILQLEPTPDLLGELAARRAGWQRQLLVGFALEPREGLLASARAKLQRKGIDMIVANPLETMDASRIEAVVLGRDAAGEWERCTPGEISKEEFAAWLMDLIEAQLGVPGV
jgi:phosphopantothenoylcysteine decarboxylase / phosphopantothenate---cysteine ligase